MHNLWNESECLFLLIGRELLILQFKYCKSAKGNIQDASLTPIGLKIIQDVSSAPIGWNAGKGQ